MLARLVLLLVTAGMLLQTSGSFVNPYKDDKQPAVKSDVKYIKCQVCKLIVKQARAFVKNARLERGPKRLEEGDIIEHLEKMCDPDSADGAWILQQDMVEVGDKIDVVDVGQPGECNTECRTIARACNDIMEQADITELSELLYVDKKGRAGMQQWLCYSETATCSKPAPAVPKGRQAGPRHEPISADKLKAKQMMQKMKAAGLGGQMYNTEDLMEQMKATPPEDGGMSDDEMLDAYEGMKQKKALQGGAGAGGSVADTVQKVVRQGQELVQEGAKKVAGVLEKLRETAAGVVAGLTGAVGGGGATSGKKGEL